MSDTFFDGVSDKNPPAIDGNSNVMELSVSEISGKLKRMVEDAFGRVRVRGEIGRVSRPASGHIYLDLKDDRAVLAAVVWKGSASKLKHRPEEGMEIVATGKLTTFPGSSKYQIIIEQIEPAGAGALMALLEERKKALAAEGLFLPERKQLLPFMPMCVGVITSPSGAVIRDILHRISDRFPIHVIVWPVRVQGETSGQEVTWAINGFNALSADGPIKKPDILIVARGGGSVEDLWGFNDEGVVRAAANSDIPIVSAVGHETDWTLIDHAADVRAPTPTGAAEMIVPVKADLEAHLATLSARLTSGLTRNLESARTGLKAASRGLPTPDSLFGIYSQRFDSALTRLNHGLVNAVQQKTILFEKHSGKLRPSLLKAPIEQKSQRLTFFTSRLQKAQQSQIEIKDAALAKSRPSPAQLFSKMREASQRLNYADNTLKNSHLALMQKIENRFEQASRVLGSFNHDKILQRGFALLRDKNDNVIVRGKDTKNNQAYRLEFFDQAISVIRNDGEITNSKKAAMQAGKKSKKDSSISQANLFGDE